MLAASGSRTLQQPALKLNLIENELSSNVKIIYSLKKQKERRSILCPGRRRRRRVGICGDTEDCKPVNGDHDGPSIRKLNNNNNNNRMEQNPPGPQHGRKRVRHKVLSDVRLSVRKNGDKKAEKDSEPSTIN